jgi:tRNA(Ile)-lysidine synthase
MSRVQSQSPREIGPGRLIDSVVQTIRDFRMFQSGDAVLVGVSGGPDSVALLHLLTELAPRLSIRLGVAHLDHGLRPEFADRDARFVAALSRDYGLPFYTGQRNVTAYRLERKLSLEEAARRVRYAFFEELAQKLGFDKIALGHHADDNAKLMLMFMIRGSGATGFSGIPPVRQDRIVRPLIRLSRREIMDYVAAADLAYTIDHTNRDERYLRNRIRHHLLPMLRTHYNPGIDKVLNRFAEIMRAENQWMDSLLAASYEAARIDFGHRELRLSLTKVHPLDPALKRRLLRKAIADVKSDLRRISFQHVDSLLRLIDGGVQSFRLDLPDRIRVRRIGDVLEISREERPLRQVRDDSTVAKKSSYRYDIPSIGTLPVTVDIPEAQLCIRFARLRPEDRPNLGGQQVAFFDMDKLKFPLSLRNICPGDRFVPLGIRGRQKVKKYFIDHKVPVHLRTSCPVLVSQGQIAWLVGHRIDERYKLEPGTRRILKAAVSCLTDQND